MDKNIWIAGALTMSLATAGCTAIGADPAPADCGATALQDRIGQSVTGTTAEDLRIGGEPVVTSGFVRIVGPDQPMTMDFRENRLTIETDEAGNLVTARCV